MRHATGSKKKHKIKHEKKGSREEGHITLSFVLLREVFHTSSKRFVSQNARAVLKALTTPHPILPVSYLTIYPIIPHPAV